ncbi:hypothetical protein ACJ41O_007591 [Fusarium nematophilum]
MSAAQYNQDRLSALPDEILLMILSRIHPTKDGLGLVVASKKLYSILILDLYRLTGEQLNWRPLFLGARYGNLNTLERCLEAGAPLNCPQPEHESTEQNVWIPKGSRAIHCALMHHQLEAVKWLLAHGAKVTQTEKVGWAPVLSWALWTMTTVFNLDEDSPDLPTWDYSVLGGRARRVNSLHISVALLEALDRRQDEIVHNREERIDAAKGNQREAIELSSIRDDIGLVRTHAMTMVGDARMRRSDSSFEEE